MYNTPTSRAHIAQSLVLAERLPANIGFTLAVDGVGLTFCFLTYAEVLKIRRLFPECTDWKRTDFSHNYDEYTGKLPDGSILSFPYTQKNGTQYVKETMPWVIDEEAGQ